MRMLSRVLAQLLKDWTLETHTSLQLPYFGSPQIWSFSFSFDTMLWTATLSLFMVTTTHLWSNKEEFFRKLKETTSDNLKLVLREKFRWEIIITMSPYNYSNTFIPIQSSWTTSMTLLHLKFPRKCHIIDRKMKILRPTLWSEQIFQLQGTSKYLFKYPISRSIWNQVVIPGWKSMVMLLSSSCLNLPEFLPIDISMKT